MKTISIKQKLEQLGTSPDEVVMGDFDYIGRFTAERTRTPDDPNYKKYGMFYRANYERGILIYNLIKRYKMTSMLEIGFGRGYSTFCAARAFYDMGVSGKIITVDPKLDENYLKMLQQVFPPEWFDMIEFARGPSEKMVPQLGDQKFDLVYIDGDHSYAATKLDWEMTKDKWLKCLLFDDYHLPSKTDPGIQCRELIDSVNESEVNSEEKELIILDRRMFFDDRRFADDQINYGQVLLTKKDVDDNEW